ncbi:FKBP-type peptidyl-prolyl cis-trans isomerase [Gordonia sp. CPCC 205515]|uniref:FKBP-type peptidyl-prolyl cis-trans isomerase n=1 Tax=Gordonia sp. CPCC 205515 TaxID=3140791 RepID=UPI003AF3F139
MRIKHAALIPAAALAMALAACGSDDNTSTNAPTSVATETSAAAATSCPTAAPAADVQPQWTLQGATGSMEMTGSTDTAAPKITITTPFSVTETQVKTLTEGDGAVVSEAATVSVCYEGVDGRDGKVFDSAYQRGEPASFPLDGVVVGFKKAIAGQKVGSTVGVAMTSADGYPDGMPDAGIQKGDTLVFSLKILSAQG